MAKPRGNEVVVNLIPRDGWYLVEWNSGSAKIRFGDDGEISDVWIWQPTPDKLRRVPLGRIAVAASAALAGPVPIGRAPLRAPVRPAGKALTDEFYKEVARAYKTAAARGLQPRKWLVEATGAADATVAGWIMEAREREYLPRTKPGKVSI